MTTERESALEGEREQRDSHFRYRSYGSGDRCFGFVTESASSSDRKIRGVMKMNSSDWVCVRFTRPKKPPMKGSPERNGTPPLLAW